MSTLYSSSGLIGRLFIATIFIVSGIGKIAAADATQAYIAAVGLPLPFLSYVVAVAIEIVGAILLIVGFHTRATASVLAVFTIATALLFHYDFSDQNQAIHFLKNLAITGGLMQLIAFGGGKFSLDCRIGIRSVNPSRYR